MARSLPEVGSAVALQIDTGKLHWFDAESGERM
jgi:hypothetical protein